MVINTVGRYDSISNVSNYITSLLKEEIAEIEGINPNEFLISDITILYKYLMVMRRSYSYQTLLLKKAWDNLMFAIGTEFKLFELFKKLGLVDIDRRDLKPKKLKGNNYD